MYSGIYFLRVLHSHTACVNTMKLSINFRDIRMNEICLQLKMTKKSRCHIQYKDQFMFTVCIAHDKKGCLQS